jgi:hypothetical protein
MVLAPWIIIVTPQHKGVLTRIMLRVPVTKEALPSSMADSPLPPADFPLSQAPSARVVHRISPPGVVYREAAPEAAATAEWPIAFGDHGDGLSTLGSVSVLRTGALGIPRGDSYWLQLMTLPPCPEGSDLFVRVGIGDLKNAPGATFRAFIGVSEA